MLKHSQSNGSKCSGEIVQFEEPIGFEDAVFVGLRLSTEL